MTCKDCAGPARITITRNGDHYLARLDANEIVDQGETIGEALDNLRVMLDEYFISWAEDAEDVYEATVALAEPGPSIPAAQVFADAGLEESG